MVDNYQARLDDIARICITCALKVHTALGPGLLESVYKACLAMEVSKAGLSVLQEVGVPVVYDQVQVAEIGFRMDLLVENSLVIEVKAVEAFHPVHYSQLLSYLRLADKRLGLLINFNLQHLRDGGIKRVANKF